MEVGLGQLAIPVSEFWSLTLREFWSIYYGRYGRPSRERPTTEWLEEMMEKFPDGK